MKRMLWISSFLAVVVGGVAVTMLPAGAHHSSAPFYDPEKSVEAMGVVERFVFRNPHSFLFINGEDEDGELIEWEVEMGAAVSMRRRGWSPETIGAGRKSMAYSLTFRAADRTLKDSDVNKAHEKIRARLADELPIELR